MSHRREHGPPEWANAQPVGGDIYYHRDPDEPDSSPAALVVWHWCAATERWRGANAADHTLVSAEPLHLEPSLLWPCCDKHGWIRDGRWTEA